MMFRKYYFVTANSELLDPDYEVIEILGLEQGVVNAQ